MNNGDDDFEGFSFDKPSTTPKCKCGCGEPAGETGWASPACEKKGEIIGGLDDLGI